MLSGFGRTLTDRVEPSEDSVAVRQSYANQMELCPARLGYAMMHDLPFKYAEGRFFGVALHEVADEGIVKDPLYAITHAEDIVLQAYINEYGPGVVPFDSDFVDAIRSAARSLFSFFKISDEDVLFQEDTMYYPLGVLDDGRDVWLQGTPDLVTTHEIIDWKTAKRAWTNKHSASSWQPALYRQLVRWNHGLDVPSFRFVTYNRRKGEWTTDVTDRDESEIESALKNIYEYGRQIAAQVFPAKPFKDTFGKKERAWYCSTTWCDAWDVCEFKDIREIKED